MRGPPQYQMVATLCVFDILCAKRNQAGDRRKEEAHADSL